MKTQHIHNMTFYIWNNFFSYKYLTHFLWTKPYITTNASVTGFHNLSLFHSLYVTENSHTINKNAACTVLIYFFYGSSWCVRVSFGRERETLKCYIQHHDHGCVVRRACFSGIIEQNTFSHGYQAGDFRETLNLLQKIQSAIYERWDHKGKLQRTGQYKWSSFLVMVSFATCPMRGPFLGHLCSTLTTLIQPGQVKVSVEIQRKNYFSILQLNQDIKINIIRIMQNKNNL